jgi:hypothetical protein
MKLILLLTTATLIFFRFFYIRHWHKLQSGCCRTHDSIYGGL